MPKKAVHPSSAQAIELLVQTLSRHSSLSSSDEKGFGKLLHPRVSTVERRTDIVCQGDHPHLVVMMVSGMLARYHTNMDGHRQYLSLHISGDLPDLQSLFLGVMDHSLCDLEQAQIASYPHREILSLLKRAPSAGLAFWRHTLIDGAIFRQAITRNGTGSAVARVANLFCEQFTRARIVGAVSGWSCPFPLSQTQIGQVVGLSIATVNRATQALRNQRCAEVRAKR